MDATKPAWRFDAAEIRSLDSEAWIPWTWMRRSQLGGFDAAEIRSLDSEAWISWTWMLRSRIGGLMRPKFEAWIPTLGFLGMDATKAALRF